MTDSQVQLTNFHSREYDNKARFISYWHQIDEVLSLQPGKLLEIGIGNKFVTTYIRDRGVQVTTLDIDSRLYPDVLANASAIPFLDDSFDLVTCFEVLEHLPYTSFLHVLKEINRVVKSNVLLSLPDVTTVYRVYIELPRIRPIKTMINHPIPRPAADCLCGEHYWEIGMRHYPLTRIMHDIKQAGFNLLKSYRIFEFPYHRFFILTKARGNKSTSPRNI